MDSFIGRILMWCKRPPLVIVHHFGCPLFLPLVPCTSWRPLTIVGFQPSQLNLLLRAGLPRALRECAAFSTQRSKHWRSADSGGSNLRSIRFRATLVPKRICHGYNLESFPFWHLNHRWTRKLRLSTSADYGLTLSGCTWRSPTKSNDGDGQEHTPKWYTEIVIWKQRTYRPIISAQEQSRGTRLPRRYHIRKTCQRTLQILQPVQDQKQPIIPDLFHLHLMQV